MRVVVETQLSRISSRIGSKDGPEHPADDNEIGSQMFKGQAGAAGALIIAEQSLQLCHRGGRLIQPAAPDVDVGFV
jgi:hypothetical protein